jgi:hypothetical protein
VQKELLPGRENRADGPQHKRQAGKAPEVTNSHRTVMRSMNAR